MQLLKTIFDAIVTVYTKALFIYSLYYIMLSLFGFIRIKSKKKFEPEKSFALVVAAHNEETVIENIVHSLINLDYPRELYDIFVIADNCTDNTATLARNAGAIVYEKN